MTALEIALAGYLAFGQPTENYYEAITKHSGLCVSAALRETFSPRENTIGRRQSQFAGLCL